LLGRRKGKTVEDVWLVDEREWRSVLDSQSGTWPREEKVEGLEGCLREVVELCCREETLQTRGFYIFSAIFGSTGEMRTKGMIGASPSVFSTLPAVNPAS
jgi:hypothetical protein